MNKFLQNIGNEKSPSFYKNYPDLFSRYFKKVLKEQIEDLSKAGYFYYHSVLSLDTIVDDGEVEELPKMLILQEESIKLLTSIYGLNSSFWDFWNKRKKEYFEALKRSKLKEKYLKRKKLILRLMKI